MMDIAPSDLRNFFEIAKVLNISRAAERLNMGQSALSQSLQRLERAIGAKVFDRFKTGVQLTAVGQRLLVRGESAIEIWQTLKSEALAAENEVQGYYSLGCHPSVAIYSLPVFLRELLSENPRLEIKLSHGLSRDILESVISFRLDFGLVMNPSPHPDLVLHQICEDSVSFYRAENGIKDTLVYDPSLNQSQVLLRKLGKKAPFRRFLSSSNLEVIGSLAAGGCGTAILPARVAKAYPELSLVKPSIAVKDRLCLIYRADRRKTAASKVIVKAICSAKI